jgi:hypothetical protein
MSTIFENNKKLLRGKTLFLSAGVPTSEDNERYYRIPDARLEIEEAIISLSRAIFAAGGHLVYGGDPAISTLIAMIAGEYITSRTAEGGNVARLREGDNERTRSLATIFLHPNHQSEPPGEILLLHQLGFINIGNMRLNSDVTPMQIIEQTSPVALICIGGMGNEESEIRTFREVRRQSPVYVFAATGGVARSWARRDDNFVQAIDQEVENRLSSLNREIGRDQATFQYRPYALISQILVERLIYSDNLF